MKNNQPHARRALLKALTACAATVVLPQLRAQVAPLRLGQSVVLSGPLTDVGQAFHQGGVACFKAANARGGINGQLIELVSLDDGYDVKRAVSNVETFIGDPSYFGLFGCTGTPMVAATLDQVRRSGMPYFTPFTGGLVARPSDMRNVFNVRPSYAEEAEELVKHLVTVGMRKIAVCHQNNAFGKEVMEGARRALAARSLSSAAVATVETDASNVPSAVEKIALSQPDAVIAGMAGKPATEFIRAMRQARRGLQIYTTSVMGAASTVRTLGDDGVGITVSQVVPMPTRGLTPLVRDYLRDWKDSGTALEPSHIALEAYVNARVLIESLRRSGRNASRGAVMDAAWGLRGFDLGGFLIDARGPGTNASRFIELTMIGRDGRFVR